MPPTENELVEHLLSADPAKFGKVYDHFSPSLYGILMKMVNNEKIAEDLLQESFLKIWNNANKYESKKSRLFTWMLNIARNTAIDHLRSKQARVEKNTIQIDLYARQKPQSPQDNAHDHIGLKKVVESLKEDHLKIIELAYFEGFSQAEIAVKLKIPVGTVKTRCRMALQHLKKAMGENYSGVLENHS
ncbi:MAG: sigma-70 family RNA polymerase sigma factor [Bacteroidetes bacterium]|nr:sigma-70 family RNA polymerase sigma factor [Bacteroidota bacterium]